ncbi:MAG: glycosyltransferase family 4 protein [Candidatus Aminicenantes bacterium]|nr:glycosyltransferase family 4 protein [Candidatus Aminicenantes bacterium]
MFAPEPYFQSRGTPISVYFRLKALSSLGHEVDLVTYHMGEDRTFKNVNIMRIADLFSIRNIKIGPSWAKIPLDFLLFIKAFSQLLRKRYDLIFSHEEAALLGVLLSKMWNLPHIYDMHSSLPQQLENFNFSKSQLMKSLFNWLERFILKHSHSVIVICKDLYNQIKRAGYEKKGVLLENFLDFEPASLSEEEVMERRSEICSNEEKIVLYTGNFQAYQGIEMLLKAVSGIRSKNVVFLLVGGARSSVERIKKKAEQERVLQKIHLTGQVDPSEIPLYIRLADVLVSPRLSGTNTPLKIYSYLKSGKPLVATDLWTHTQVLNEKICILVKPEPEEMAKGIEFALSSDEAGERAEAARKMSQKNYTFSRYKQKIEQVLEKAFKHKNG